MKPKRTGSKRRLLGIVWPFIVVVVLLVLLGGVSLNVLSAVRAYVSGESLWSKGQKDAIYSLSLYADTRSEEHYRQYQQAIAVPLGDHAARLALDRADPDLDAARAGFLAGGNHPDDLSGLIWLFQHFRHFSYLERAIAHWTIGDRYVEELTGIAEEMHASIGAGRATASDIARWRQRIHDINRRVTPAEKAFSDTLGEASRYIQTRLLFVNLFVAAFLIALALLRTSKLLKQRQAFESALRAEKERAQITLSSIGDAVITTDTQGCIEFMNPGAEKLTAWTQEDARGLPLVALFRIVDEDTQQEGGSLLEHILAGREMADNTQNQLLVRRDNSEVSVSLVGAPIYDDGRIAGAVLVFHDMTREHQYIANLSWQASHDALTGLVNRREFEYRLELALDSLRRQSASHHTLMYLDLDQFKIVNDTCGHAAGDELLRQICLLLQQKLRDSDTLARLGGDEFGILLENCPDEVALRIAETLRKTVQDLHFVWGGQPFSVSVSIGLVHVAHAMDSLEELLRAADIACYMAKERGRNRIQVYHPDDSELSQRYGEMTWIQRIHLALEENRFCLYAQEIAPLHPDKSHGAHIELLLRLFDEGGKLVPPVSFIPAAERYGLMPTIDRWVVKTAFATLNARALQPGNEPIAVCSINLSGTTIGDDQFLKFLREEFAHSGVPPQQICFEITETSAIANLASAIRFIRELQALGCRFSLDDFGSGMSSFAYLKHLPVDFLKIDGSFVKDMLDDPIDHAMVEMINRIGQVMGKQTIAEFVETPQILHALGQLGVDYAQGYEVSRPHPFTSDCAFKTRRAAPETLVRDEDEALELWPLGHQEPLGKGARL